MEMQKIRNVELGMRVEWQWDMIRWDCVRGEYLTANISIYQTGKLEMVGTWYGDRILYNIIPGTLQSDRNVRLHETTIKIIGN